MSNYIEPERYINNKLYSIIKRACPIKNNNINRIFVRR